MPKYTVLSRIDDSKPHYAGEIYECDAENGAILQKAGALGEEIVEEVPPVEPPVDPKNKGKAKAETPTETPPTSN